MRWRGPAKDKSHWKYCSSCLLHPHPSAWILVLHPTGCCSVTQSCLTLCNPMDCSTLGLPVHRQLPELAQTHVHCVGDAIQPSHPLLSLLLPPSIFPSIRVFSNESAPHIRWRKDWSFSFSISPSSACLELLSFGIDRFDLAVQGILKNLLQHYSLKASILQPSAFFMVQLSQTKLCSSPRQNSIPGGAASRPVTARSQRGAYSPFWKHVLFPHIFPFCSL